MYVNACILENMIVVFFVFYKQISRIELNVSLEFFSLLWRYILYVWLIFVWLYQNGSFLMRVLVSTCRLFLGSSVSDWIEFRLGPTLDY